MYIRNKSGLIQECHNEDVIQSCRKDADNFMVAESLEDFTVKEEAEQPEAKPELDKMTVPELKVLAKENGIEGAASLNKAELLAVLKGVV